MCWPGPHSCGLTTSSQRRETPVTSRRLAELPCSISAGGDDVDDGFGDEDGRGDDDDESSRQCPYCMKVFSRKYDVIRHVNNNCNLFPYYLLSSFYKESVLYVHTEGAGE